MSNPVTTDELHQDFQRLSQLVQKVLVMLISSLLAIVIIGFAFAYNFHGRTSVLEHVNGEGKRWTFEMQQEYRRDQDRLNQEFSQGIDNLNDRIQGLTLTVGTIQSDVKYIRERLERKGGGYGGNKKH